MPVIQDQTKELGEQFLDMTWRMAEDGPSLVTGKEKALYLKLQGELDISVLNSNTMLTCP